MKINKLSLTIVLILIFIMVLWFVQNQSKQESDGVQLSQDKFEQSLPQPEGDNLKFVYELSSVALKLTRVKVTMYNAKMF